jgi:hypothetical protein
VIAVPLEYFLPDKLLDSAEKQMGFLAPLPRN